MVATLYLLGSLLTPGQPMTRPLPTTPSSLATQRTPSLGGSDWLLMPRLGRSQELVYRGTFNEEGRDGRIQFNRAYRLETRIFVLETPPRGAEVAILTILKHRPTQSDGPRLSGETSPSSVRLERAHVDLQGKVTTDGDVNLAVPLEGAPTIECGAFVALPGGRVALQQEWQTAEEGRPLQAWRVAGTEMVSGDNCVKLVGLQQSEDWDRPRADRTAWKRQDTVWLSVRLGIAHRLERVILRREPAHQDPTQKSVLRWDLESSFLLSGEASESRRQEIKQALDLRESVAPLLAQPARYKQHLSALITKINYHLENHPDTPYRIAVLQVRRQAEAGQRGEALPPVVSDARPAPHVATLGELAPDFVATHLTGAGSGQLRRWLGRPVLLVFYHPASATSSSVLGFAQKMNAQYSQRLGVIGMSVSDDTAQVRRQHSELKLTFPVLSGGGLRVSFGAENTPKFVLLDAANIVRGEYTGWGQETAGEIQEELKHWLPPGLVLPASPPHPSSPGGQ
jgi:peroxiredoxin